MGSFASDEAIHGLQPRMSEPPGCDSEVIQPPKNQSAGAASPDSPRAGELGRKATKMRQLR